MSLFRDGQSPAHYTSIVVRETFPRTIARGMKVKKMSDTQVLLQDIDEWLWADQQLLQSRSKYELSFDCFAAASDGSDDTLRGLVVAVSATPTGRLQWCWRLLLAVVSCVVLMLWVQTVLAAPLLDIGAHAWWKAGPGERTGL